MFTFLAVFAPAPAMAVPVPIVVLLQMNRIAGAATGTAGFSGDAGPALLGALSQPESVSIDGAGNLYIADTSNNRVRRIDVETGTITTVAGNGQQGYGGDSGPATNAALNQPTGILADPHGNLYIADTGNGIVRLVNIETGIITTVVGIPNITPFDPAKRGDGGPPLQAELDAPAALALDVSGNLYIADSRNNRVRKVSQITGTITTVAGDGSAAYSGDGGLATQASLNQPTGGWTRCSQQHLHRGFREQSHSKSKRDHGKHRHSGGLSGLFRL
jgi:sugar lactone lactonase YvrE